MTIYLLQLVVGHFGFQAKISVEGGTEFLCLFIEGFLSLLGCTDVRLAEILQWFDELLICLLQL